MSERRVSTRPPRATRVVWVRAILLGVVLLTLPLDWVETTASCGRNAEPVVRTGAEVFANADAGSLALIGLLALYTALASALVRGGKRAVRVVVHLVTFVATGFLTWIVALLTSGLFTTSRFLPGGFVAITCLLCACADALVRVLADAAEALRDVLAKRGRGDQRL